MEAFIKVKLTPNLVVLMDVGLCFFLTNAFSFDTIGWVKLTVLHFGSICKARSVNATITKIPLMVK